MENLDVGWMTTMAIAARFGNGSRDVCRWWWWWWVRVVSNSYSGSDACIHESFFIFFFLFVFFYECMTFCFMLNDILCKIKNACDA